MKKILFLAIIGFIVFSCAEKKQKVAGVDGRKIFKQNCVICHGLDGKLGINGSKDLTLSILTRQERIKIVKEGKGAMQALGGLLSDEEIIAVADYTMKLK